MDALKDDYATFNDDGPLLQVQGVTIAYQHQNGWLDAVRNVNLTLQIGQTYGLVGESGSGKSTLALAIMRYLSQNGSLRQGTITLNGNDLMAMSEVEMREIWSSQLKLVPQNALSSLNPSLKIGEQIAECLGSSFSRQDTHARVRELLAMVRLSDPDRVADSYPHELSGGMQQRVMIAMALSAEPALLVLDEPTTALDVTTEAAILDLVDDLVRQHGTAVLYVSHNLGVIARICDRVAVLYSGELVEDAAVADLYRLPLHPYSLGLLNSVPKIGQHKEAGQLIPIPGSIPHLHELPNGCVFAPRCPVAVDLCHQSRPELENATAQHQVRCHRWPEILSGEIDVHAAMCDRAAKVETGTSPIDAGRTTSPPTVSADNPSQPVLQIKDLEKHFALVRSVAEIVQRRPSRLVRAVDGVDLEIDRGRTLGLVGESGSGKTTLARCVVGLAEASDGEMRILSVPLARALKKRDRAMLQQLQMVFQNPDDALNPYLTVRETLRRPLLRLASCSPAEVDERIGALLEMVKLRRDYAQRLPSQLSGGEKQRVAIARAFAAQPDLLIFDESVSALDVSVQASILNLLNELQRQQQSAYLFITHDLGVVSYLADDIAVIYLGQLMEVAKTEDLLAPPYHPYTEALLSAIPVADPAAQHSHIRLDGDVPSPVNVPSGCPFHTRCPRCIGEICATETPRWQETGNGHRIYCHIPLEDLRQVQQRVAPGNDES